MTIISIAAEPYPKTLSILGFSAMEPYQSRGLFSILLIFVIILATKATYRSGNFDFITSKLHDSVGPGTDNGPESRSHQV